MIAMIASTPAFAGGEHMDRDASFGSQPPMQGYVQRKMDRLDTNRDGMVSSAELNATNKGEFMKSDTNRDGALSSSEMKDAMSKKIHRHRNKN